MTHDEVIALETARMIERVKAADPADAGPADYWPPELVQWALDSLAREAEQVEPDIWVRKGTGVGGPGTFIFVYRFCPPSHFAEQYAYILLEGARDA